MYCEITVGHRKQIDAAGLESVIRAPFNNDIPVATAYGRSAIYRAVAPPPVSLFAFDTVSNCFVIVRKVNVRSSTYHLEGNAPVVSVETMLQAAEEFSGQLVSVLEKTSFRSPYRLRSLVVQLFEDNGRETGMQGRFNSFLALFKEQLGWTQIKSAFVPFVTAQLLIWRGLKQEPLKASVYSLAIALVFALADASLAGWRGHGKIKWKLRQS
jgi:hypothetical protein